MAVRHDSYHTALNLLVVANLFASGLLAGGFVWLWLMLPPAPLPDTGGPRAAGVRAVPHPDRPLKGRRMPRLSGR
ncbi:hypothetical protein SEEP1673_025625 (plasmid) [Salmonella enterica subsp. enterica serovar Poona str. ATCC BAA-1673]|nr:hypothetical protein SEEP1673_025625 [Salmonella enterica subsp. enterica serovar Poona str. ATCC BAA-1673]